MMTNIIKAEGNLPDLLKTHNTPIILDFWAPWCGPCLQLNPVLDQLSTIFAGKLHIIKVDVDKNGEHLDKYGVQKIPTLVFINKNGEVVEKTIGYKTVEELSDIIKGALGISA